MSGNGSTGKLMSGGYAADLESVLDGLGADPRLLTLEITESVFLRDSDRSKSELRAIFIDRRERRPLFSASQAFGEKMFDLT